MCLNCEATGASDLLTLYSFWQAQKSSRPSLRQSGISKTLPSNVSVNSFSPATPITLIWFLTSLVEDPHFTHTHLFPILPLKATATLGKE